MSKQVDYKAQLRRLYNFSMVLYVTMAIVAAAVMNKVSYQLTVSHLAKDELASQKSAVLVPGTHALFDLRVRLAVVIILLLSAIVPSLYTSRWQKRYQAGLRKQVLPWRWVDIGVTSALMVEVIAIVSGVQDIAALKILAGLMIIMSVLGWLAERAMNEAKKLVKPLLITGLVAGLLPWLLIAVYALATPFYGAVRAAWYVYALYGSSLVGFGLLMLNEWQQSHKRKQWKDYRFVEYNYAIINLVNRVAFAAILIVGLKK
ncbi:heliorhodopsin HeR [Candidatus Saccharibacteria bacterium]|nr:heliorhodopsin HeR [Candidatus Saccharibacteria bacterium]